MKQQNNTPQQNEKSPGRKPDLNAWHVKNTPDGKSYWNKVGSAWTHRDGQGVEIRLDSIPVDGHVTLREIREERMQEAAQQRQEPNQQQGYDQQPAPQIQQGYEQEQ